MTRKQIKRTSCLAAAVILSGQAAAEANDQSGDETDLLRPRIGVALGGGGCRGAAHIGVLRVFEKEHIPIDFIAGTSVGSVVGGLYSAGVPLNEIQEMFENKSLMRAYIRVPISLSVACLPLTMIPRAFHSHQLVGLYRGEKFARYIEQALPAGRTTVESTIIPFRAVATDLLSGKPYAIDHGPLERAIEASSAIPWLKKPVRLQDRLLCDGFLVGANLPVSEVRTMGADLVICVDIDGPPRTVTGNTLRHIRSFRHRTNHIMVAALDEGAARSADVLLKPDVGNPGLFSTRMADLERGIAAGETAARAALPRIRRLAGLDSQKNAYKPTFASNPRSEL